MFHGVSYLLLREFTPHVSAIVPFRAYSAATMLAIGANEIVMHPFAEMGPIDPSVSNDFNPVDPQSHQRVSISVEDVKAYVGFIKETVGIRHEDELIKAVEILANKVHPLALGNVERFIAQSRMIAAKLLKTHMKKEDEHKIDELVETLASKLYFHGHPINRVEATELGLPVAQNLNPALETAMWKLYLDFENELQNNIPFDPMAEIFKQGTAGSHVIAAGTEYRCTNILSIVECERLSSVLEVDRRFIVAGAGPSGEPAVRGETLSQSWKQIRPQAPAPAQKAAPKKKAR